MKEETFDQHEARLKALDEMHEINLKIIQKNNLNPMFQGLFETIFPNLK
jgi:hypothetical protein